MCWCCCFCISTDRSPINRVIFPIPTASYGATSFPGELCWLPNRPNPSKAKDFTPCLFLKSNDNPSCFLIYTHQNYSDIGRQRAALLKLRDRLRVHILMVEYPGYGPSSGKSSEGATIRMAEYILKYVCEEMKVPEDRIIWMGRSVGTGVGAQAVVRSRYKIGALVLISPFTSIANVVKYNMGKRLKSEKIGMFLSKIIAPRFDTLKIIHQINCPLILLHGEQDDQIPPAHSRLLANRVKGPCHLVLCDTMDHNNSFEPRNLDFIAQSISVHLSELLSRTPYLDSQLKIDPNIFQIPQCVLRKSGVSDGQSMEENISLAPTSPFFQHTSYQTITPAPTPATP
eukprot:NODE_3684_length_1305_cov_76.469543_g3221_i0.p1 GENE.NODE_3684_length_1305_cov_76.469543_g3221_i0~~NODE_3684_length_1305_cov_76.469543_g3221_i0.p1  ORF type:complete len:342 (-),score=30.80 NODE_3684_length_1305_cov_76.469543_g3221_i0:104-1129(-)